MIHYREEVEPMGKMPLDATTVGHMYIMNQIPEAGDVLAYSRVDQETGEMVPICNQKSPAYPIDRIVRVQDCGEHYERFNQAAAGTVGISEMVATKYHVTVVLGLPILTQKEVDRIYSGLHVS